VIALLRHWRLIPEPTITIETALKAARSECERRGWPWEEPVRIEQGLSEYFIRTNLRSRGGNASIRIDANTGAVTRAFFANR
jgi:hypothetical protein